MTNERKIVIIAGPNGAGKTTFAKEFLPHEAECPTFINADLIAESISPHFPDAAAFEAGRQMLATIDLLAHNGQSFAFETTLSGRAYAQRVPQWRKAGFHVKLFFIGLPNVEIAVCRVARRVSEGGHNVPPAVIERRFEAGRRNFETIYKKLVDWWIEYDNSGELPVFVAEGRGT